MRLFTWMDLALSHNFSAHSIRLLPLGYFRGSCDGMFCKIAAIGVDLPNFVLLEVTHTEPGIKGDTATGATKPATLETGYQVQVPLFVNQGDKLKIDTRTGEYVERV